MKTLEIVKAEVLDYDLSYFKNANLPDWLYTRPGEHYKLLSYLANKFNNTTVIDAGTYQGYSALALAQNPSNRVKSYDIMTLSFPFLQPYTNVELLNKDINNESKEVLCGAPLISLDIDPHDGEQEARFIEKLVGIGYEGYVVCDDIHLNANMNYWWSMVTLPKYDITDIGHVHGTGLICFGVEVNIK